MSALPLLPSASFVLVLDSQPVRQRLNENFFCLNICTCQLVLITRTSQALGGLRDSRYVLSYNHLVGSTRKYFYSLLHIDCLRGKKRERERENPSTGSLLKCLHYPGFISLQILGPSPAASQSALQQEARNESGTPRGRWDS